MANQITNNIICLFNMDCFDFLRSTGASYDCIFADPPDNLGLSYEGFKDHQPFYYDWLNLLLYLVIPRAPVVWLSYYYKHDLRLKYMLYDVLKKHPRDVRTYIWRYRFGQYGETDNPNGYRPILRISRLNWRPILTERMPSVREQIGDARATGKGRIPDDVWDYSRVQGNNTERRSWHPTQHPEELYRRIMRMSIPIVDGVGREGTFLDLFAGTGTCFRARWDHIKVTGIELSPTYCERIADEHPGIRVRTNCCGQ